MLVDGMLFGLLACAQAYSHDWPEPPTPAASAQPMAVQIHIYGGLPYLPGDVVELGNGSSFVAGGWS